MTTVRDIIKGSLRLIGEVGEGQTMSAEQGADGLASLIGMVDSWSIQAGMIYTETKETVTLTANTGDYTIGTGGTLSTVRPIRISSATVQLGTGVEFPILIIGRDEYAEISDKTSTGLPEKLYYDLAYPLGNIRLNPIPSQAYSLTLYSDKPLTTFSSLDDVLTMPQGYERALRYNLAVEQAPEYEKEASATVQSKAVESKNLVINQNLSNDNNKLSVDPALSGYAPFNIYSNQ